MSLGASGQHLHLRLFIEGIEVPVIAAQVSSNINAPATASIQIVPHDSALQFKPRTMIHLFYWDYNSDLPTLDTEQGPVPAFNGYRVLFIGEVIGLAYQKNPLQRSLVLQCADLSTYWDTTYQIFISYGPRGNFLNESSAVWAGGNSLFHDLFSGHVSVLNSYLRRSPLSDGLKGLKGLMGGIVSLLEVMGGVPNHTRGVNDFYAIAELKNRLLQQITAEQDDDTAQRLFDQKAFMAWLTRGLQNAGNLVTFRDMIKLLFKWIYYEVVPVTCPQFIPGTETVDTLKTKREPELTKATRDKLVDIRNLANRLAGINAPAPGAIRRDAQGNPIIDSVTGNPLRVPGNLSGAQLAAQNQQTANPGASQAGRLAASQASNAKTALNALELILKEELPNRVKKLLRSAVVALSSVTETSFADNVIAWGRAATFLNSALSAGGRQVTSKQKDPPKLDRLAAQVFRPDCFFVSPPRCNVVFPEHETSFTFNRQFLQEITRLRLGTSGFITGGGLFGNFAFAPLTADIRRIARQQGNAGIRGLLPWELYSGILPKFEHLSEANFIANQAEKRLRKGLKGKMNDFAQRAANFNYFKYRFAARSVSLNMKFNPDFILGFPALIIDKPWIVDHEAARQLAQAESGTADVGAGADILSNLKFYSPRLEAPLQYLGMVAAMAHNVDQNGGSTSATLTHARTHRITDDDFLLTLSGEIVNKAAKRVVSTVLNLNQILKAGDLRLFRFLVDATPQDPSLFQSNRSAEPTADEVSDTGEPTAVSSRPTGIPATSSVSGIAGDTIERTAVDVIGGLLSVRGEQQSLRGSIVEAASKNSRDTVIEPKPYAKLKPGSKGPARGTVVQIQLSSDQIREVREADFKDKLSSEEQKERSQQRVLGRDGSVYAWVEVTVLEEVPSNIVDPDVPAEEAIRPPWFSPLYSSLFIGERIYRNFFGTGAVVDEAFFLSPGAALSANSGGAREDLITKLSEADGDAVKTAQIFADAKQNKTIKDVPSIELAVDALAYIYGEVRRQNLDVHRFVSSYVARPIATFEEILGTVDLQLEKDASGKRLRVTQGKTGFHSQAIAPFDNLLGLLDDPDRELPRLRQKGKKGPISKSLDPRPGRREKVEAYARAIQASTGKLGVGLGG